MVETLKAARAALISQQEAFQARRNSQASQIKEKLPQAEALSLEIRHVFTQALSNVFGNQEALEEAARHSRQLQEELSALLISHGYEGDSLFDKPFCAACKDSGYLGSKRCQCLLDCVIEIEQSKLSSLQGGSFGQFDLSLFSITPDVGWGFSQRENMEGNQRYCQSWAKHFGENSPNLFLNGGTGQGKTFLCACIASEITASGFSVRYATAVQLFNDFESQKFDRGGEPVNLHPYYQADLLVIDDLGTEMTTAFVQSVLYDIINTRLLNHNKTIINANLTAEQLTARYMPQVCSRLLGEYRQLHFFGPDIRLSGKHTKRFSL